MTWEAPLATMLRDAQWIVSDGLGMPDLFLTLDGNVERIYGDTFFQRDRGYFLFELKGQRKSIDSEWTRRVGHYDQEKKAYRRIPRIKSAHEAAVDLAVKGISGSSADRELLLRSIRGHHFVFWDQKAVNALDCLSGLVITPYVLATVDGLAQELAPVKGTSHGIYGQAAAELSKGLSEILNMDFDGPDEVLGKLRPGLELPFSSVYTGQGFVRVRVGKSTTEESLGMTANETLAVAKAVGGKGAAKARLNGVVWGVNGYYRETRRLEDLLGLSSSPAPDAGRRPSGQQLRDLRNELAPPPRMKSLAEVIGAGAPRHPTPGQTGRSGRVRRSLRGQS